MTEEKQNQQQKEKSIYDTLEELDQKLLDIVYHDYSESDYDIYIDIVTKELVINPPDFYYDYDNLYYLGYIEGGHFLNSEMENGGVIEELDGEFYVVHNDSWASGEVNEKFIKKYDIKKICKNKDGECDYDYDEVSQEQYLDDIKKTKTVHVHEYDSCGDNDTFDIMEDDEVLECLAWYEESRVSNIQEKASKLADMLERGEEIERR